MMVLQVVWLSHSSVVTGLIPSSNYCLSLNSTECLLMMEEEKTKTKEMLDFNNVMQCLNTSISHNLS